MWFALSSSGEIALAIVENLLPTEDADGLYSVQNPQVLRHPMWCLTFVFSA